MGLILKKISSSNCEASPAVDRCRNACDIALQLKKYNLLVLLLNSGRRLGQQPPSSNIEAVSLASEYGIKIDTNDVALHYDCRKVNENGETVFHLMASARDQRLLSLCSHLKDALSEYSNDLKTAALRADFVELIELLFTQRDLEA